MLQRIALVAAGMFAIGVGCWSLAHGEMKTRNGGSMRGGSAIFFSVTMIALGGYVIAKGLKESDRGE
ncbi:MAG: hypothetical protein ACO1QR_01175 [Chthoniobacteraceae bacterium]